MAPTIEPAVVAMCGQCLTYLEDVGRVGTPCEFGGTGLATDNCLTPAGRVPIMRKRRGWVCLICREGEVPTDFFFDKEWAGDHEAHIEV